jgi:GNAT superfamily N-acetyltransferase
MMTYNPPRYQEMLESAGLSKAKDLYAYASPVHAKSLERLARFSEKNRRREPNLTTRDVDLKEFKREVQIIREIYNRAWERNWGFVPTSEAEFDWLARDLKPLVDPKLLRLAFMDGDPAAFLLALPDVNPALAVLDGSLWNPVRLVRAQLVGRRREGLRLITMGVKEQYRLRGIEAVLFYEGLQAALDAGYRSCEYSWILEDNELTKRTVRLMDAELTKIYRMYALPL